MGAFTAVTQRSTSNQSGVPKIISYTALGPASYDTGGSIVDLGVAALGVGVGFNALHNVQVATNSTSISARFLPGASPLLGKLVAFSSAVADAGDEVAGAADLSAITFSLTVIGV